MLHHGQFTLGRDVAALQCQCRGLQSCHSYGVPGRLKHVQGRRKIQILHGVLPCGGIHQYRTRLTSLRGGVNVGSLVGARAECPSTGHALLVLSHSTALTVGEHSLSALFCFLCSTGECEWCRYLEVFGAREWWCRGSLNPRSFFSASASLSEAGTLHA